MKDEIKRLEYFLWSCITSAFALGVALGVLICEIL